MKMDFMIPQENNALRTKEIECPRRRNIINEYKTSAINGKSIGYESYKQVKN